ncbi:MAG: hypothetical protein ACRDH8_00645 [Actinomycetota bacterium]
MTSFRGRAARIATILAVALTVLVVGGLAASAQTTYPPPTNPPATVAPAEVSPAVVGAGGGGGGGGQGQPAAPQAELAFTGAELTVLLIVLGGLVLGGVVLYAAGRRRAHGSEA